MNCSNLNADLHSLHVTDSPACVYSLRVKDAALSFLDCSLYYIQGLALQNTASRFNHCRLETLLYGDGNFDYETNVAIVLAVLEFIKDSERFEFCNMGACGQVDRVLDWRSEGLGFDSSCWLFIEVPGKLLIPYCLYPPLWVPVGTKNWKIVNGISCRKCTEFSPEEIRLYERV